MFEKIEIEKTRIKKWSYVIPYSLVFLFMIQSDAPAGMKMAKEKGGKSTQKRSTASA